MDRTIKKTMQHLRPRHEPAQTMQLPKLSNVPLRTMRLRRSTNGDDMKNDELLLNFGRLGMILFWVFLGSFMQSADPLPIAPIISGMFIGMMMGIPYFIHWLRQPEAVE